MSNVKQMVSPDAERFKALFDGFSKAHGRYKITDRVREKDGKREGDARTVRGPVPPVAWNQHLLGSADGIGIIPLRDDDTVKFAVIDIDEYDADLLDWAKRLAKNPAVLCRSKSGGGHLYVFFQDALPSELVFDKLRMLAANLGCPDAEIFPKQIKRSFDDDAGNWINLPYYGDERKAIHPDGHDMPLEEFLEYAEKRLVSRERLDALKPDVRLFESKKAEAEPEHPELADGPPCLASILNSAVDGTLDQRNIFLHQVSRYVRKKHGVEEAGEREFRRIAGYLKDPLPEPEIASIWKSAKRKERPLYSCNENLLNPLCKADECAKRAYGMTRNKGGRPRKEKIELDAVTLADFNKRHAVIDDGGETKVLTERRDPDTGRLLDYKLSTVASFINMRLNRKREVDAWLAHDKARRYQHGFKYAPYPYEEGVAWSPDRGVPPGYYNLWRGFAVTPRHDIQPTRILDHIRGRWCRGDSEYFEYVVNWLAWGVQNPAKPAEAALVLQGGEGTGKGIIVRAFGSLWAPHFVHAFSAEDIVGKFNGHFGESSFTFFDEAFFAGDLRHSSMLRGLISEPTLRVEKKFENRRTEVNTQKFIFAANAKHAVDAAIDSRRYFALEVLPKRPDDGPYFDALNAAIEGGEREALFGFLLSRQLGGFHPSKMPAPTEALQLNRELSESPARRFIRSVLDSGQNPGTSTAYDYPKMNDLNIGQAIERIHKSGSNRFVNSKTLLAELRNLPGDHSNNGRVFNGMRDLPGRGLVPAFKRVSCWTWGDLVEARRAFDPNGHWDQSVTTWRPEEVVEDEGAGEQGKDKRGGADEPIPF